MLSNSINLSSLDIQQARIKFILFKSKLRSVLYGSPPDETMLSPRENSLGQWLYNTGVKNYSQFSEIREIENLNLRVISQARELINLYNRGQMEEARKGLEKLDASEKELIRLLDDIKQKI